MTEKNDVNAKHGYFGFFPLKNDKDAECWMDDKRRKISTIQTILAHLQWLHWDLITKNVREVFQWPFSCRKQLIHEQSKSITFFKLTSNKLMMMMMMSINRSHKKMLICDYAESGPNGSAYVLFAFQLNERHK